MPHGGGPAQNSSKLNPHGDSVTTPNKYQDVNEYYSINTDPSIQQLDGQLLDSNLTSLATQQLSKNTLWKPTSQYDVSSWDTEINSQIEQGNPRTPAQIMLDSGLDIVARASFGSSFDLANALIGEDRWTKSIRRCSYLFEEKP